MFQSCWTRMLALIGLVTLGTFLFAESEQLKADLAILKAASQETDSEALLSFFKKRTLSDEICDRISELIDQLGADQFAAREKATADLLALEGLARPQLTQALKSDDLEIRKRARLVLQRIGTVAQDRHLYAPAARILASRKDAGSAKVLLDFLPSIDDEEVAVEVAGALQPLALDDNNKPNPVILAALSDRQSIKRTAAGLALAKSAATQSLARKLLKDPELGVRRQIAITLLKVGDKQAVPTLINLVAEAAEDDLLIVEDTLLALAGDKAPQRSSELDAAKSREQYHKRWLAWWKEHGTELDLSKVDFSSAYRGYTLVTMLGTVGKTGTVAELDASGKVRWQIDNLNYPVHASMHRRDRVLICEYNSNRITERDLKGNVLWSAPVGSMLVCAERLPNGNVFYAARNRLVELDSDGKAIRSIQRPSLDVLAAQRHKDGTISIVTTNGNCVKFDQDGGQVSSINLSGFFNSSIGFRVHFLPHGGLVVPDYTNGKIREYDHTGRMLWEIDAYRPSAVMKLRNGNLLYASRLRNVIIELDKNGREVARRTIEGRPLNFDQR